MKKAQKEEKEKPNQGSISSPFDAQEDPNTNDVLPTTQPDIKIPIAKLDGGRRNGRTFQGTGDGSDEHQAKSDSESSDGGGRRGLPGAYHSRFLSGVVSEAGTVVVGDGVTETMPPPVSSSRRVLDNSATATTTLVEADVVDDVVVEAEQTDDIARPLNRKIKILSIALFILVIAVVIVIVVVVTGGGDNENSNEDPSSAPMGTAFSRESCQMNSDCRSGFCNKLVGSEIEIEETDDGICDERPPGSKLALCTQDTHCQDDIFSTCTSSGVEIGNCRTSFGESCSTDDSGNYSHFCVSDHCGANLTCSLHDLGQRCTSSDQCTTGRCDYYEQTDVGPKVCMSLNSVGEPCDEDSDCWSGASCNLLVSMTEEDNGICDNRTPGGILARCREDLHCMDDSFSTCSATNATQIGVCRRSFGEYCAGPEFLYYCISGVCEDNRCTKHEDGQRCEISEECLSDRCDYEGRSGGENAPMICLPKGGIGAPCTEDFNCEDGTTCNLLVATTEFDGACDGRTPGGILARCREDSHCMDDSFSTCSTFNFAKLGVCQRSFDDYCAGPEFHYYCISGECTKSRCTKHENGQRCRSNEDCTSGNCDFVRSQGSDGDPKVCKSSN